MEEEDLNKLANHNPDEWISCEFVLHINDRKPLDEKNLIVQHILPFINAHEKEIDLFHFTRIYEERKDNAHMENFIRLRVKPKTKSFKKVKKDIEDFAESLHKSNRIIDYRIGKFGYDKTHMNLQCNPEDWNIFLEYLNEISKITIKLLEREKNSPSEGILQSSDYYSHFLINQFGGNSLYGLCRCGRGSFTLNPCNKCLLIRIPKEWQQYMSPI